MRKLFLIFILLTLAGTAVFLLISPAKVFQIVNQAMVLSSKLAKPDPYPDIENQQPLLNPPEIIKAVYATNWSMSNNKKIKYFLDLIDATELNAIVIDIKDYTGIVPYKNDIDLVNEYNAWERRILEPNKLIKTFHDRGIYVIGRISVFQDLQLAEARPDLALISSSTSAAWKDNKGLTWMDTAAEEVWDYNIAIAKDILARGFDEVNFDYIRFASDGNLNDIKHPYWDEKTLKTTILKEFFKYLRENLPNAKLSADLFGLATIDTKGVGIGQHLEHTLPYFDAVAPMVYPSHYFTGFQGYEKPAEHPYEVVKYSMDEAIRRTKQFIVYASTTPVTAKFRPWLQDFDLRAD
ncbi:MAG: putative glycoside hydrolase, partial [Patescibacteria group bacterium]